MSTTLPPAEALPLDSLVTPTEKGIASRVLARSAGGNVTLFAFDAGEELSEHTAPFDALVLTPAVTDFPIAHLLKRTESTFAATARKNGSPRCPPPNKAPGRPHSGSPTKTEAFPKRSL